MSNDQQQDTAQGTAQDARPKAEVFVHCPLCGADDYRVKIEDTIGTRVADPRRLRSVLEWLLEPDAAALAIRAGTDGFPA